MTSSVEKNMALNETAGDSSNKTGGGLNLNNKKDEKEKKFGCC